MRQRLFEDIRVSLVLWHDALPVVQPPPLVGEVRRKSGEGDMVKREA